MARIFSFILAFAVITALGASGIALAYTPPSVPPPTKNVYETIVANKKLGKFAAMIDEAGLKTMLTGNTGELVTVFAPDDDALGALSGDVKKRIQANLQSFIKYHIIAGSMVSSGAIKGRRASPASANGEALPFDGSDASKPPRVGDGSLEQADIVATNGVVHIVNRALVPPSLAQASVPVPASPVAPPPPMAVVAPSAPAKPARAVATTTTGSPAAATTTASPSTASSAVRITTSGVAKAPAAAVTTSSMALSKTTSPMTLPMTTTPSTLPVTTTGTSGFELFGHKFGW